jgi:multidrug efflux pump subunit AcrB
MWITRVSINNPVFATMFMVGLMVLGLVSYGRLGVEQMPDVSAPGVYVNIQYPGASPAAVETEVTKPIEQALNAVAGIKTIRSNSFEGRSESYAEFSLETDMGRAVQDVRDKIAVIATSFPRDAKAPTIGRFDGENAQPVIVFSLKGADRSLRELSLIADQTVVKQMERVSGVARVEVNGLTTRQVLVELNTARLRAYGITPAEVSDALRVANNDVPVGLVSDQRQEALIRVEGKIRDPLKFAATPVARRGLLMLTVGDLGTVIETEQEPNSISRVGGQPAVSINVYKVQDANLVNTGEALKAAAATLRKQLPAGIELQTLYASSDFTKSSLNSVKRTIIEGGLLTIAIVFLFLHSWRSTVITGLTLPIAVIATFIAIYAFGFTLNYMTMMALSLCIGLLIDDAIVVRENIVRHVAMGKDHFTAAREGTEEIGLAVMATTFAICAVFVPIAFMKGIIGKFFYPFGITVTVAVMVSLFVSFTLDPMLSSIWKDPPNNRMQTLPVLGGLLRGTDRVMDFLHRVYENLIHWIFSDQRWRIWLPLYAKQKLLSSEKPQKRSWHSATITPRGVVLAVGALSFVSALMLVPLVGTEFIPQTDQGFSNVSVRMPVGTSLARTNEKARQIEEILAGIPEIKSVGANVGGGNGGGGRNTIGFNISLTDRSDRSRSQSQIEEYIRTKLTAIPGVETQVGNFRPIWINVLGPDPVVLDELTGRLADRIKKVKGVIDLETSVKPGIPAFAVKLRPEAARDLGLTASQIAASLRTYVNGDAATYWTTSDGQQVEVLLRLPRGERQNVGQIKDLPVAFSKEGLPIVLSSVADISPVNNPEVIKRQNLQRRQGIYAGVEGRPAGDVGDEVQKIVKSTELPTGYFFDVAGQTQEQQEAFGGMLTALGMSVIFIYIVLASQFGSFLQPIAIMASLPLSLIGVMLALLITRSTLNLFSIIGLIMLMGLVTKNAILLVDFANNARKAGSSVKDALMQAGMVRMRPIIMTTSAMVFGMLPLALALGDGGELQAPMGRAIIGGVITSTLLTLIVVPVIYSYLVKDHKRLQAAQNPTSVIGANLPIVE